jgi:uncharacterized protein YbbC (DUF1343 family)/CubicO group peptidase (beta-lactamase class C family)
MQARPLLWAGALWLAACTAQAPATHAPSLAPQPAPDAPLAQPAHEAPAAVATAAVVPEPPPSPARIEIPAIDALVQNAIAAHKLPGCVIAIGRRDGVVFERAYGQRAIVPAPAAMTEDTIFDLASLTKPVATATALALLAEQGRVDLEAPAARYLKELNRAATRAITVRQLLVHGAGLPPEDPLRHYMNGHEQAVAALLATDPVTPPGTRFGYSDVGYLWLGELVARVAGKPLDVFVRDAIYAPLGMLETRFSPPAAWLARIAPTEVTDDRGTPHQLIHGVVHDPRAYRLGGVAGNAGLFSTARDLSRYARMLLGGGELDGVRVLQPASVAKMTASARIGDSVRTLGWDMRSMYSRLRGTKLSERAFGHGGYTGVSLWIDPGLDLFVLLLSNRVHPDASGNVIGLAGEIADAAVNALEPEACLQKTAHVQPGIDVLRAQGFAPIAGKRIGVLTHLAARTAAGEPTLSVLQHDKRVHVAAIFTPEHGLQSAREGAIADARDAKAGVPIYSLFGATRRPTAEMLAGLDAVVVDLVDVGTRFYTYMSTLHEMLRAASENHVEVIVLDRPNPIGGVAVEGPLLDAGVHSFVNHMRLPVRHGMSAGELARLMNDGEAIGAQLRVVEARGVRREMLFADTGLRWFSPSPNLPDAQTTLLYPAIGLLESTNLSVGRGTKTPFAVLGAPWIDAAALAADLQAMQLPGVRFEGVAFTPKQAPYAGQACHGVRLVLQDPRAFQPVRSGLAIAHALLARYRTQWQAEKLEKLLGHAATLAALERGDDVANLPALWQPDLARFEEQRRKFLIYPRCDSR